MAERGHLGDNLRDHNGGIFPLKRKPKKQLLSAKLPGRINVKIVLIPHLSPF